MADYHTKAAGAEREAETILTEARAEAARFAELSRADLTQPDRAAAPSAAQDKIGQAEAAAMREIRALAADAAVAAAQKLIQARMDEQHAGHLIAESIKDLGGKLN